MSNIKIKRRPFFLILLLVGAFYIFFTTPNTMHASIFHFSKKEQTIPNNYYALLSEGFLQGQLSLSLLPSHALLSLQNPYDPDQNKFFALHDASLYKNKYYLYFGPLPAILFFIPIKLITNYYPSETCSVFFFLYTGFIVLSLLLLKIRDQCFPQQPTSLFFISIFLLGFSTTAPFLLTRALFYEDAIAANFCMMSFALLFLYQMIESEFKKYTPIILFSFFLSSTVAARPNFSFVCLFVEIILCLLFIKKKSGTISKIAALILPSLLVAILLATYNYLRFDSIFDFGIKYQLAGIDPKTLLEESHFSWFSIKEKIYYFFLQRFYFSDHYRHFSSIPHILLGQTWLPKNQIPYYEPISGVLVTSPILLFALTQPLAILLNRDSENKTTHQLIFFLRILTIVAFISIIFFLFSFLYPTERYEMDFVPYLLLMAIIHFWLIQKSQLKSKWVCLLSVIFYLLAVASILIGLNIGITGYGI